MNSRGFPRYILYVYHVNWGKPNRGINFKVMHAHVLTKNGPPPCLNILLGPCMLH